MPKRRSTGGVYARPGTKIWWFHYSLNGKIFRESSGTANRTIAQKKLDNRLDELARRVPQDENAVSGPTPGEGHNQ